MLLAGGVERTSSVSAQDKLPPQRRPGELESVVASKPLRTPSAALPTNLPVSPACQADLEIAVSAFRLGEYESALDRVTQGLARCPGDSTLQQFRGLILFAKGEYAEASVSAHRVVSGGSTWTWATVYPIYADAAIYTKHLRALESFTRKHPDDGPARFLQAYHYRLLGSADAAARELEMVIRLEYNDVTAVNMLRSMGRSATSPTPITPATTGTY